MRGNTVILCPSTIRVAISPALIKMFYLTTLSGAEFM
jgi:hypothetical protein